MTQAWGRAAKALGLRVRLHDLRHSAASLMLAQGVPVRLVSERLGHASSAFTLDTYAHVLPGAQHEAAEGLARILANGQMPEPLPEVVGV